MSDEVTWGAKILDVPLTTAVVICAYTEDRWDQLCACVDSVLGQSPAPDALIVSVDHNEALYERCQDRWASAPGHGVPIQVIRNKYDGRLGSARNSAADVARGDLLMFIDDDAAADAQWLAQLVSVYEAHPEAVAVGGAALPVYETRRPRWFPKEFDWVFGCSYAGLPEHLGPLRHLIGANMSVRRHALSVVGGFHSDDHDDMDMCHRLAARFPERRILYQPEAVVRHHVPARRVTWSYFWRRCFFVNKGKVHAFAAMDTAANLSAETTFALRLLTVGMASSLRDFVGGDLSALARMASALCGLALAGAGNLAGRLERVARRRHPR